MAGDIRYRFRAVSNVREVYKGIQGGEKMVFNERDSSPLEASESYIDS